MRYSPTPYFVAAMTGLIMGALVMCVLVAIQKHRIERDAITCVDPTGHYERECPDE